MKISPRLKKLLIGAVVGGIVVFVVLQLVPVEGVGTNPPERYKLDAPPDVQAVLARTCLDCHSNETRWPFYSRIAPGSWLMARDVTKGRKHLNLSEWGETDQEEQQIDRENMWEQIESGAMPPWFYVYPMHLSANLSDQDKAVLKGWMMKDKDKKKEKEEKGEAGDKAKDDKGKDDKAAPAATGGAPAAVSK